jgi:transcriptional regulator with XRE-family HTH domain
MADDKPSRTELAQKLEQARNAAGVSQRALARDLGITQGHYSKIVTGLVADKKCYVERGLRLLSSEGERSEDVDRLVQAAAREIRASPAFRRLVDAALGYSRRDVS